MSAEACFQHPDRPAVERCEVCRRPVCGSCLWYADSGERLCPEHGTEFSKDGKSVHPPERYAAGIPQSEVSAAHPPLADAPYKGNSADVGALVAAVAGVTALASCAGLAWVLPLLAFGLGLIGWLQAKDAVNPSRTRWLSGIGLASGSVLVLFFLGFIALMFMCMLFPLIASSFIRSSGFPLPTPPPFPTP